MADPLEDALEILEAAEDFVSRMDYTDCFPKDPIKFAEAFELVDALKEEFNFPVTLAGGAIRDIYFDIEPKDWDVWIHLGTSQPDTFKLVETLINKLYMNLGKPQNVELKNISNDIFDYKQTLSITYSLGYYSFKGKMVNIILTDQTNVQLFDFDINTGYIYNDNLGNLEILALCSRTGKFNLNNNVLTRENVTHIQLRVDYITEKTGISISPESWLQLNKYDTTKLEQSKQVIGYRTFKLENERLVSPAHHTAWESKTMIAECGDSVDKCVNHLLEHEHRCGINMFKSIVQDGYDQYPVVAECEAQGIVNYFKLGYRSEKAEITQIWLIRENLSKDRPVSNGRLKLANQLQEFYGVPVHVTDARAIKAIISARSQKIELAPSRNIRSSY